jgi:erythromycin esterase
MIMRVFTAVLPLLLLGSAEVSASGKAAPSPRLASAAQVDEDASRRWITANRQSFSSSSPESEELAKLTARLSNAEIIGIGEATHGTHEDLAFKSALIKQLVREGRIEVLALEANRAIGTALDAYVRRGEGDPVDIVRSPSFFRIWRTEEFVDLITWLRGWTLAGGKPVQVVGVDVQDSSADAIAALDFVASRAPAQVAEIRQGFGDLLAGEHPVKLYPWIVAADKAKHGRAVAAGEALQRLLLTNRVTWGEQPGYTEALYAATTASQGLKVYDLEVGGADPKNAGPDYWARRDRMMAANLVRLAGGRRVAIWAHDMHVLGEPPAEANIPDSLTWLGREMSRRFGPRYVNVQFAWTHGRFHAATATRFTGEEVASQPPLIPQSPGNKPGSLGHFLGQVEGDLWWIDLRQLPQAAWAIRWSRRQTYWRGWGGWGINPRTWQTAGEDKIQLRPATDILVYFRTITPTRLLPGYDLKPIAAVHGAE